MGNYANFSNFDFSGGMDNAIGSLVSPDNECRLIVNGELEQIGPIHKIRGYEKRGEIVNNGYEILGSMAGVKSDGTIKQIVIADGETSADAYTFNPINGQWTPHGLSLSTGARAEFEYFLDGFFMVNFEDATRWNNYIQWFTTTNVTNAPKAKYIKQYLSRIYLAYVSYDGNTYPSRVVYSNLPDDSTNPMTISWNNSENYFDVDSDDADVIRGLDVNANRLLIFKEKSLHRYDTNTRYRVPGAPGTTSNRSIVTMLGYTIYLNKDGLWIYDGTTSRKISRKIDYIIKGMSTKNIYSACAWQKGDKYFLYAGDIDNEEDDIKIEKCLIEYDVPKNAFTVRSIPIEITTFHTLRDDRSSFTYNDATVTYNDANVTYNGLLSAEDRIYCGTKDGKVYHFDYGNSFDGADIPFIVETKDYYLNYPAIYKLFQKVFIFVSSKKAVTVQFKIDDGRWKTLGRVTSKNSELVFPSGCRGKKIRFRLLESGSGERFSFDGFDIYFTLQTLLK